MGCLALALAVLVIEQVTPSALRRNRGFETRHRLPPSSPLPVAALPSISLVPPARFTNDADGLARRTKRRRGRYGDLLVLADSRDCPARRRAVFLTNARWFDVALCWLFEPGTCGIAPPPRLNVDFVVNTALFVKTLQIRQQGRLRELHRL